MSGSGPKQSGSDQPLLYGELAGWFHLLTAPEDYGDEAAVSLAAMREAAEGPIETMLELGSGGGNSASHLKAHVRMTLTDPSESMLAQSRTINPECEHIVGDMRTLRLDRAFDAVFVHDAVSYLTSEDDLAAAIVTAFAHLRPGGVALFIPDFVRERYRDRTGWGGHDDPAGDRGLRYVEWMWDPDPADETYVVDFAYLLRGGERVEAVHDRHVCGAFRRASWLRLLAEAGFLARSFVPNADEDVGAEHFLATRPADGVSGNA
ncbi:MAG: class I SAM-dependent methyltransferase [Actinomycetota bacterium]